MNDIIKNIEAAQLKESVPSFNVGDTVRVSAKIKEGNRERIQIFEGTGRFIPRLLRTLRLLEEVKFVVRNFTT